MQQTVHVPKKQTSPASNSETGPADWMALLEWGQDQLDEVERLAFSYLREGLYKEAVIFFRALVVLRPRVALWQQTLGALYLQIGQSRKALKVLRRALELDPSHLLTLLNKAKALLSSGDLDRGLMMARPLTQVDDPHIADTATALLMGYEKLVSVDKLS